MLRKNFNSNDAGQIFGLVVFAAIALSVAVSFALSELDDTTVIFWVIQGCYSILLGLIVFLFSKACQVDFVVATKLNKKPRLLDVVFLCAALFFLVNAMTPINEWFCDLIEMLGLRRPSVSLTDEGIEKNIVLAIVTLCFIAPIAEELIFRGAIGNGILHEKNKTAAIFFGGFLFAIFHMNPAQTLHQFLVGSLLMLFLICDGSLWTVVIGHVANNVLSIVLFLTVEKTGFYTKFSVLCAVLGLLLFFAVVAVYIFLNRQKLSDLSKSESKRTKSIDLMLIAGVSVCLFFWLINLLQM